MSPKKVQGFKKNAFSNILLRISKFLFCFKKKSHIQKMFVFFRKCSHTSNFVQNFQKIHISKNRSWGYKKFGPFYKNLSLKNLFIILKNVGVPKKYSLLKKIIFEFFQKCSHSSLLIVLKNSAFLVWSQNFVVSVARHAHLTARGQGFESHFTCTDFMKACVALRLGQVV